MARSNRLISDSYGAIDGASEAPGAGVQPMECSPKGGMGIRVTIL